MSDRPAALDGLLNHIAANTPDLPDEDAATAKARAAIAPLEKQLRAAKAQERAEIRRAALLEGADHLTRQANELWAPGTRAHNVMLADAGELRRMAAEAQPGTETHHAAVPAGAVCKCPGDCGHRSAAGAQQDGVPS